MIEPKILDILVAVVLAAITIGLWLALYKPVDRVASEEEQMDEKNPVPAASGNGIQEKI